MQDMLRQRYLDLMEKALIGLLIEDPPIMTDSFRAFYRAMVGEISGDNAPTESDMARYQENWRKAGWDQPSRAFTMVGLPRLQNFRQRIEAAVREGVPGDVIETGVWRGGAAIMAKAVLDALGETSRQVWLADSFAGLPPPDPAYPQDAGSDLHLQDQLAVSMEDVQRNFERFSLLDERVRFLKGWFKDTLPTAPIKQIAVARLDGDMYESTMTALQALYDRVSPGGSVIIDDYWIPACKAAVHDFLSSRNATPQIEPIDGMGVWFRKQPA